MPPQEKQNAEVFVRPDGSLYHLGVKEGEIHPRILTVGERSRARMLASNLLDDVKEYEKTRNFLTFSGTFNGVPVSIVSIGMGAPNMDFLVREASYIFQDKGLAFIRLGTCGIFNENCSVGTLFISDKMYYAYRNYALIDGNPLSEEGQITPSSPCLFAGPVEGDKKMIDTLQDNVEKQQLEFFRGTGISAENFYCCQGRNFPGFASTNEEVLGAFSKLKVDSCEMESHQLYSLCKERFVNSNLVTKAASICVGVVSRVETATTNRISEEAVEKIILAAGRAALETLVSTSL